MRVLINADPVKIEAFNRVRSGAEFASLLEEPEATADAAAVVRGPGFAGALAKAVSLGLPVVVVAGAPDEEGGECARLAAGYGVPEACVLFLKGGRVATASGEEIAPAARNGRGVGLGAVVRAAAAALERGLLPEPVVWEIAEPEAGGPRPEEEEIRKVSDAGPEPAEEAGEDAAAEPAPGDASPAAPAEGPLAPFLALADAVLAVFKASPEADSSSVAAGLAEALGEGAFHLEVAPRPAAYRRYGSTLEEALQSGRYAFADGSAARGLERYAGCRWLVAEVDPDVPDKSLLDEVYSRAAKVALVASHSFSGAERSRRSIRLWLDGGWRLDALVVDRVPEASHVAEIFEGDFGREVGLICGADGPDAFKRLAARLTEGV